MVLYIIIKVWQELVHLHSRWKGSDNLWTGWKIKYVIFLWVLYFKLKFMLLVPDSVAPNKVDLFNSLTSVRVFTRMVSDNP